MDNKIAGTNDEDITYHNHSTQRNVAILVDDGCNDIRTTRTSSYRETESDSAATENGTQESCP